MYLKSCLQIMTNYPGFPVVFRNFCSDRVFLSVEQWKSQRKQIKCSEVSVYFCSMIRLSSSIANIFICKQPCYMLFNVKNLFVM